jgi:F-type H+-transporting ATPase subunit delta
VVDDPISSEKERQQLVDELASRLGLSTLSKNAVQLLAQRRRLAVLPEIAAKLSRLTDEHNKVVRVLVTSAEPLSEAYSQELVRLLEQSTGKRIVMEKKLDPSLIAGVVTTIGDNSIDGSLSGRLRQMEQQLFDL